MGAGDGEGILDRWESEIYMMMVMFWVRLEKYD